MATIFTILSDDTPHSRLSARGVKVAAPPTTFRYERPSLPALQGAPDDHHSFQGVGKVQLDHPFYREVQPSPLFASPRKSLEVMHAPTRLQVGISRIPPPRSGLGSLGGTLEKAMIVGSASSRETEAGDFRSLLLLLSWIHRLSSVGYLSFPRRVVINDFLNAYCPPFPRLLSRMRVLSSRAKKRIDLTRCSALIRTWPLPGLPSSQNWRKTLTSRKQENTPKPRN